MFIATSVLWTFKFMTGIDANETRFKDGVRNRITADVNSGKLTYSEEEILEMFNICYERAGSTNPANKARQTWTRYAKPGKESWFVGV